MTGISRQSVFYLYVILCLMVGHSYSVPVLNGIPDDEYVGDGETSPRIIHFLNVTDATDQANTCTITSIVGSPGTDGNNEFEIKKDDRTGFEIWTTAAGVAAFNVATISKYVLTLQCTNNAGAVSSATNNYVNVHVAATERVTYSTLPETVTKDVTSFTSGSVVYTESLTTAIPAHASNLECGMHSSSISGYFNITQGTSAGTCRVMATANLVGIDASQPTAYLVMSATDPVEKITVYEKLTLTFTNQNTIPSISNTASTTTSSISESVPVGTSVFQVTVSDPDSGQSHTFTRTCDPTIGDTKLTIDTNGKISTADTLDFETNSLFTCQVYINDGIHTGGPFPFVLTVTDANETPTFSGTTYYATMVEGDASSSSVDASITCTDVDPTNTLSYQFLTSTYSPYFAIDSSGMVKFAQEYDVDTNGLPTAVVLTVLCVDANTIDNTYATATATLSITVTDFNDNAPTFNPATYTLYTDQTKAPGTTIGSFIPVDPDSGPNGQWSCTATSSSSYGTYFSVGSNCVITQAAAIDFPYGTVVQYDITATDQGTPSKSGTGRLDIIYKEVSTTTVSTAATTTAGYNFFDHAENIAMFVLLLLAALALLGLLSYCLARMCCGSGMANMCDCNMRRNRARKYPKRRAVTPEETPPRRRKSYSPPPQQKVTVIRERPPVQTIYKQAPPYYQTPGRYPGPGTMMPGGQFPRSPFVPYR